MRRETDVDFVLWLYSRIISAVKILSSGKARSLFEKIISALYNSAIIAAISNPAYGKEVTRMEILLWILKTVAETVIRYGLSKVLDYLLKRH